ncbi:MAG: rod shape-determining protein RodA [Anaplasmataceae bacterium]|nr:rod shape-determining protein RodA [Anaplasmataceae bacterium]
MFNKLKYCDKILLFSGIFLSIIGIVLQLSTASGEFNGIFFHHIIFLSIAWLIIIAVTIIDMKFILKHVFWYFILTITLLVTVKVLGNPKMGANRWLDLGFFNIQPSEITKISLILILAKYFENKNIFKNTYNLIIPLILFGIPEVLILMQPNLGTAIILSIIFISILYIAGLGNKIIISLLCVTVVSMPIIWNFLYDYQKKRVLTFLNPESDPLNSGYNILQSKIAIGSGGIFGKGFLSGTQTQLRFLPEKHTDFIFTVLAEEWGLIGSMFLYITYAILIIKGISIASNATSNSERYIAIGVTTLFFAHCFINTGMVVGLLPVVGVPLPFISYGGTIMLTSALSLGLLLNISIINNKYNKITY